MGLEGFGLRVEGGDRGALLPEGMESSANMARTCRAVAEREFFIDDRLVRIHFVILMIRWAGLAPREFELPFPGGLSGQLQALFKLHG